ncbi:MAG: OmpA family protein [Paracoccaceae bacterium]
MRLSAHLIVIATFLAAAIASTLAASFSVTVVEEKSEIGVRKALDSNDLAWAEVQADGLQVTLSGMAPTEAGRFSALSTAGSIVDAARVIDDMEVEATAELAPPRFSVEILRNDAGITLIGLVPSDTDRVDLVNRFRSLDSAGPVSDFLEMAAYPEPDGWTNSLEFALVALDELPRSKVSVTASLVSITAISDSPAQKKRLEAKLTRALPRNLLLDMNISAPRPVITPFTLRFVLDSDGARFDACSADTEASGDRILKAAHTAGLAEKGACVIGMGVPSPNWATAAELAIASVAELGGGSVTFSDADITLIAIQSVSQRTFDKVVGELETSLPDVFALHAVLPEQGDDQDQGPPEFVATLSPEGLVQLRGRVTDEHLRDVADSFARSRFGSANVYTAARIASDLPQNWPLRILTGLEALSLLKNGAVVVEPKSVSIQGNSGDPAANANIASLFAEKLGTSEEFTINVTYQEKLDPLANIPTPEECEKEIGEIIGSSKIVFEPSSANIDASAMGTMDDVAEILKNCGAMRLEIQGHTDSQGREVMNQELSQARAQSVLDELRSRRVLTSAFVAKGYGETLPIADNGSAEGRETNRRIEFKLIRPKPIVEVPTGLEQTEERSIVDTGETEAGTEE